VFLYVLCDVQWKDVEGSNCRLIPSAVTKDGSVDCGKLSKISGKLFEFNHEISFEVTEIKYRKANG
jgi:hypothetical protein